MLQVSMKELHISKAYVSKRFSTPNISHIFIFKSKTADKKKGDNVYKYAIKFLIIQQI